MTDKIDPFAEMQRAWVTQQQEMLNNWVGTLKNTKNDSLRASWRKAVDVMEQQVQSALTAQQDSLMKGVANVESIDGLPEAAEQHVDQLKTTIGRWAKMQTEIWHVWFELVREAAPAPKTPADSLMESWEDMAKRTMDIQRKWMSD